MELDEKIIDTNIADASWVSTRLQVIKLNYVLRRMYTMHVSFSFVLLQAAISPF